MCAYDGLRQEPEGICVESLGSDPYILASLRASSRNLSLNDSGPSTSIKLPIPASPQRQLLVAGRIRERPVVAQIVSKTKTRRRALARRLIGNGGKRRQVA